MSARLLYTIGYEKTLLKDVVSTLAAARVTTLIDVRDRPISRRPGFSKRQLAAAIEDAGMRYVHLQALGTPPEGRLAGRRREWDRFWGIVEEKLARPEAELALQEAGEIAEEPIARDSGLCRAIFLRFLLRWLRPRCIRPCGRLR